MSKDLKLQGQQLPRKVVGVKQLSQEIISQRLNQQDSYSYQNQDKEVQAISNIIASIKEEIDKKIYQHNQNVKDIDNGPTIEETQACVKVLEAEFPMLKIDLIAKVIHQMLHPHCNLTTQDSRDDNLSASVDHQTNSIQKSIPIDYTIVNSRVRAKESVNIPIDPRMPEQKRVAISYLNFGYGVRILRDYINDPSMNPTKYNNIITSIMKISFRKLQEYIRSMGKSIVAINSMQEKIIRAPLTNCQKWMPPDQLQVFYKLIKYATGLDHRLDIQAQTAVKLYNSCIRQLQQRQANEAEFKRRQRRDKKAQREKSVYLNGGLMEGRVRQYDRSSYPYGYSDNRNYKLSGNMQRAPPPYGRYTYDQIYAGQQYKNPSGESKHWQSLSQQSRYQLKPHPYREDNSNYTTY